jgi:hypothetical protein
MRLLIARAGLGLLVVVLAAGCGSSSRAGVDAGEDGPSIADLPAPRPVAPVSVSFVTSQRPVLRWVLPAGVDGAHVEVCADRACARLLLTFDATGDHGAPPADLPPGVAFWHLRGTSGGAIGAQAGVTWEMVIPARSASLGTAWGAMLDANGDGYGDVAVGDSNAFIATQHVYVHHGGPGGPSPTASSVLSAPAPVTYYAASIASAGDVDGDGFADLLVGSPQEAAVYIYRGGPAGYADPPAWVLTGPSQSSFGAAVSGAGDVDGDGYADVVVGLPLRPPASGSQVQGGAILYYGAPGGPSSSRSVELGPRAGSDAQGVGTYVSTAGDVDGDGLADVAVWGGIETTDPQYVFLYLGSDPSFGALPTLLLQYDGANPSWLGNANLLVCAGDTDGDGYADLAVSTPVNPGLGFGLDHYSLFLGGGGGPALVPSRQVVSPLSGMDHFGLSLAALDADQDGIDDIAVTTAAFENPAIDTLLYPGLAETPGVTLTTADVTTLFEREVGSAGDVDGDGFPDLFVGFPSRATPLADAGAGSTGEAGATGLHGAVEIHPGGPSGVAVAARWTLLPPDTTAVAYGASLARP